jgi:lysophospholipid acyltransferase (LPLAT)-like uncharacterized protein
VTGRGLQRSRGGAIRPRKRRSVLFVAIAGRLAPPLVRILGATLRWEATGLDTLREARATSSDARVIYCCWHENLLLALYALHLQGRGGRVLVSGHSNAGEILTRAVAPLGIHTVRGATKRGGDRAVLQALRPGNTADLGLTPDGPRGPRRRFQPGGVFLAARSGLPLIPVGCAARWAWRLSGWDHFQIPKPFSRVRLVVGAPLIVPFGTRRADLEPFRLLAERSLEAVSLEAEESYR